ncbi:MAG: AMP-binding protein, partial [Pseudomonadota bacterium]
MNPTLWTPSPERIEAANMTRFRRHVADAEGVELADYNALFDWSVAHIERFWVHCWDFLGVKAETRGERVLIDADKMPGAKFFPDAKLNFAQNLLRVTDDRRVVSFWGEDKVKATMTGAELSAMVSRLQQFLKAQGVGKGDRVAGFVANTPETLAAMLAATSLGAVWSSCSPDFGVAGVLDRFGQIGPKVLFATDGYY